MLKLMSRRPLALTRRRVVDFGRASTCICR